MCVKVSDGALRCFASLADRFTRRGVDPAPLAQHGIVDELLFRLKAAGEAVHGGHGTSGVGPSTSAGATALVPVDSKSSASVSTVISLLSTLCRGSPCITHDLLRSHLLEAIESGLKGDERLVCSSFCESFLSAVRHLSLSKMRLCLL